MEIIIPSKLSNLLHGLTDDITAAVGNAFTAVNPILKRNESPFFQDYTDHGIQHINNVLRTCELIISEDAWSVFTREDAATLILATIAHDLGMLISKGGFHCLVDPSRDNNQLIEQNDQPWPKLWREYQLATRRFDGAMLTRLLGSPEPVPLLELDSTHFTDRGLRMAGEFLRRHHHRLAHEIILYGLPSENGLVRLFNDTPKHLMDIAGLVARSHGVHVRNCLESLIEFDKTGHREYRYIHPTFLMTLVRLADYLDLDHGRTPTSILEAKSLKSPISRREWWSHKAIVACHSFTDDPECLHVVVEPDALPDIDTFVTIEGKVAGIQNELDSCWAVLGEVYGRFPPLNRLSLKIRRIRSDLRGPSIINQLPFVPHKASLESSKSDLLKLLISPLYGDKPEIGVRELLQNSIDAVRELEFTLTKTPSVNSVDQDNLEGDIVVNFEKDSQGDSWIIINDLGIGMTWETVCKYYLTAGASFRQSDAWKQKFIDDDSGESQILRSGRFGVGILAAFLLGNRVQVSTRYFDEPEDRGVFFEFGLDDTTIELKWGKRKVGTTIKIRTNKEVLGKLFSDRYYWKRDSWDWFCLKKPIVVRHDMDGKVLKQKINIPEAKGKLSAHQHAIQVPGYQEIHWTYASKHPALVCNGILISDYFEGSIDQQFNLVKGQNNPPELTLAPPKVSVFDPDGCLPLNLVRDRLASTPQELLSAITDDVCRNFIAFCLAKGPRSRLLYENKLSSYIGVKYTGWENRYRWNFNFFFDTPDGFGLCDSWNFSQLSFKIGMLIRAKGSHIKIPASITDLAHSKYNVMYGEQTNDGLVEFDRWHKDLVRYENSSVCLLLLRHLQLGGIRTLMQAEWYKRFSEKQPQYIVNKIKVQKKTEAWVIWTHGDCPDSGDTLISLANEFHKHHLPIESMTECFTSPNFGKPKQGRIAKMWQQVIGGPIIPFDKKKRQKIIDNLGEEFKRHLAEWNSI